jgi:hypothetical protein
MSKICSKCHNEKDVVCFRKQFNGKEGLRASCKDCDKSYKDSRRDIIKQTNTAYAKRVRKLTLCEKIEKLQTENEMLRNELTAVNSIVKVIAERNE